MILKFPLGKEQRRKISHPDVTKHCLQEDPRRVSQEHQLHGRNIVVGFFCVSVLFRELSTRRADSGELAIFGDV